MPLWVNWHKATLDRQSLSICTAIKIPLFEAFKSGIIQVESKKISGDKWRIKTLLLTIPLLAKCIWFCICSLRGHLWGSPTGLLTCRKRRRERKQFTDEMFTISWTDSYHHPYKAEGFRLLQSGDGFTIIDLSLVP